MTLTHDEMLDVWRLIRGFAPLRADSMMTRTEGVDLDSLLTLEMQAWYDDLLLNAPLSQLCPRDIALDVSYTINPDGTMTLPLPEGVVRVACVKLDCWERSARILNTGVDDDEILLQASPYSRAGVVDPVAIVDHGTLRLCSVDTTPDAPRPLIERLEVVVRDPAGATFSFQPSVLKSLIDTTL